MKAVPEGETPVIGPDGSAIGTLRIRTCGDFDAQTQPPLLMRAEQGSAPSLQVLEGTEYYYEWKLPDEVVAIGQLNTDIEEVFFPDEDPRRGRLRPRLATGTLNGTLRSEAVVVGSFELEVRSKKLAYESEYQWMLRDVTEAFADALLLRFATSSHHFVPDATQSAQSLYQRFAFLKAVLNSGDLEEALRYVFAQPHVHWKTIDDAAPPGTSAPPSSALARQLTLPGPRTRWPGGEKLGIPSLPTRITVPRTVPDVDNAPNRFVRYALEHWRSTVSDLLELMERASDSQAVTRGRREGQELLRRIDGLLAEPLLRKVSRMEQFPAGNQVLQKKTGYRAVLKAFLQGELAASLTWTGGEDVYGAGKRDVATLYEYWAYLTLARILADMSGAQLDLAKLLQVDRTGVTVKLTSGKATILRSSFPFRGVPMEVDLHFNRAFLPTGDGESWTRYMRPDCSIRIKTARSYRPPLEPVWLHFDAKYRVENVSALFGKKECDEADIQMTTGEEKRVGIAKRSDLLKMHAYRDAIRRSLGAFVVYPGDTIDRMSRYPQEILPGLGAFPLRPQLTGMAAGSTALRGYLAEIFELVANEASQQERHRYWKNSIYGATNDSLEAVDGLLTRPPDDLRVTLGYVRSQEQLDWISKNKLYNMRADEREGTQELDSPVLTPDLLVLYLKDSDEALLWKLTGKIVLRTKNQMEESGYPSPRGEAYLCLQLEDEIIEKRPEWLTGAVVRRAARVGEESWSAPKSMSWGELWRFCKKRSEHAPA